MSTPWPLTVQEVEVMELYCHERNGRSSYKPHHPPWNGFSWLNALLFTPISLQQFSNVIGTVSVYSAFCQTKKKRMNRFAPGYCSYSNTFSITERRYWERASFTKLWAPQARQKTSGSLLVRVEWACNTILSGIIIILSDRNSLICPKLDLGTVCQKNN